MDKELYTFDKIDKIFDLNITKNTFYSAAEKGEIPKPILEQRGKTKVRKWSLEDLPEIGKKYSFLKNDKGRTPLVDLPCAVLLSYAKKGGVLKTTCAFNLARIAAINGIKTCIIGLDNQCDISRNLGYYHDVEELDDLVEIEKVLAKKKGLYDIFTGEISLGETIKESDLPTLLFIPETDQLEQLAEALEGAHRREFWLEENVIEPLRKHFDLIVIDCSPTSGRLLQNAINSADMIMAPIECGISNFRNFKSFEAYLKRTLETLKKDSIALRYIPTKLNSRTALSKDIFNWYVENIPECTKKGIKIASNMEDSILIGKSILEHQPNSPSAEDIKDIMTDILFELDNAVSQRVISKKIALEQQLAEHSNYGVTQH